jgi:DNA-binding MarR family transcriptional regulator
MCARTQVPVGRYDPAMADQRRTPEPDGLPAFANFLRAHAAVVRTLEQRLDAHQLVPIAQYDVLLELNAGPGRRLRMQELSDRVVLSRSRVSRVVDEMLRAGLVRKEPDPDDRRASFAVITDAGRAELRRAAPEYLRGIEQEFLAHLTAAERRTVAHALGKVALAHEAGRDAP